MTSDFRPPIYRVEHAPAETLAGYLMRDYEHAIGCLAQARTALRISLRDITKRGGPTPPSLSRAETRGGAIAAPSLFDLAHALGYDLALIPREDA